MYGPLANSPAGYNSSNSNLYYFFIYKYFHMLLYIIYYPSLLWYRQELFIQWLLLGYSEMENF